MADSLVINMDDLPVTRDLEEELRSDMVDHGITPPIGFLFDGKIHRFGKDNSCWYVGYNDSYPCAQYKDWASPDDVHSVKVFEPSCLTVEERAEYEETMAQMKVQREAEEEQRHREAAATAKARWEHGRPLDLGHPYIKRKKINPKSECRMSYDGRIMLPQYNEAGEIVSLQYINDQGEKRFLTGGKRKGSYGYIPGNGQTFLCEGWATAESIHEATGAEVFYAFAANNLKAVGEMLTRNGKAATVVADNDKSGTGLKYARETGLDYILIPVEGQDANDYYTSGGNLKALLHRDKGYKTLAEFLGDGAPMEWLIKDILPAGDYGMIYGASGAGKSFYVLSMMCALSNPRTSKWNGHRVRHKGLCVYLVGEGAQGVRLRVAAMMKNQDLEQSDLEDFVIIDDLSADLDRAEGALKLKARLDEILEDYSRSICLLVVDTLNVFFSGDENSSQDARNFNNNMNDIIRAYGCTVIPITHTGVSQDAAKRIRGSSAFRGNLGFELLVEQNKNTRFVTLSSTKSKDTDGFVPVDMKIITVDLGREDEDGDRVTAGALVPVTKEEADIARREEEENNLIQDSWELVRKTFSKHPHQREDGTPYLDAEELIEVMCKAKNWKRTTARDYFKKSNKVIGVLVGIGALVPVRETVRGQVGIKEFDVADFIEAGNLRLPMTADDCRKSGVGTTPTTADDKGEYISPIYPPSVGSGVQADRQQYRIVSDESAVEDPFPAVENTEPWRTPDYGE